MERKTVIKIALLVFIIIGFVIYIYISQQPAITPTVSSTTTVAQPVAQTTTTFNSLSTTLQTSAMILSSAIKIHQVLALAVFL